MISHRLCLIDFLLQDDLRLTELDRVKLVAAFETALHIQVSEPIVWQRSTTLESLYADVEKQLAVSEFSLFLTGFSFHFDLCAERSCSTSRCRERRPTMTTIIDCTNSDFVR